MLDAAQLARVPAAGRAAPDLLLRVPARGLGRLEPRHRRDRRRDGRRSPRPAPPVAWVLNNHDMPRSVTRYAGGAPGVGPGDIELGRARARAAALLMLALPGSAYLYQGEELGLPEVVDLPVELADRPDVPPHRRRSAGAGRLPGPAAVGRRPRPRSGSRPATVLRHRGCRSRTGSPSSPSTGSSAGRLDAAPVQRGDRPAAPDPGAVVQPAAVAAEPSPACSRSPAATASCAWSTAPPSRCAHRSRVSRCSRVTQTSARRCRRTPQPGGCCRTPVRPMR